jgi:hypothetical protein
MVAEVAERGGGSPRRAGGAPGRGAPPSEAAHHRVAGRPRLRVMRSPSHSGGRSSSSAALRQGSEAPGITAGVVTTPDGTVLARRLRWDGSCPPSRGSASRPGCRFFRASPSHVRRHQRHRRPHRACCTRSSNVACAGAAVRAPASPSRGGADSPGARLGEVHADHDPGQEISVITGAPPCGGLGEGRGSPPSYTDRGPRRPHAVAAHGAGCRDGAASRLRWGRTSPPPVPRRRLGPGGWRWTSGTIVLLGVLGALIATPPPCVAPRRLCGTGRRRRPRPTDQLTGAPEPPAFDGGRWRRRGVWEGGPRSSWWTSGTT